MAKNVDGKTEAQDVEDTKYSEDRITSLSTFHRGLDYKTLKGMLEYEKPHILVEFDDEKKEIRFVFEKQSMPSYIR